MSWDPKDYDGGSEGGMIDAGDFLAEFHEARALALRRRMESSPKWWREYLDRTNAKAARDLAIKLWIALLASALAGAFYR
jgi:hypothetical protein